MTLYLGMLVDIILFVLFSLSVVLIYSLMMINVQVMSVQRHCLEREIVLTPPRYHVCIVVVVFTVCRLPCASWPCLRQKRTFEIAVRRLLGSSRTLLAALLGVQVSLYAIPSWIVGLGLAQLLTRAVLQSFQRSSG